MEKFSPKTAPELTLNRMLDITLPVYFIREAIVIIQQGYTGEMAYTAGEINESLKQFNLELRQVTQKLEVVNEKLAVVQYFLRKKKAEGRVSFDENMTMAKTLNKSFLEYFKSSDEADLTEEKERLIRNKADLMADKERLIRNEARLMKAEEQLLADSHNNQLKSSSATSSKFQTTWSSWFPGCN